MCAYRALKKKSTSNGVSLSMRPNSNNKLGYKGVDLHQGRYRARITWRSNQYELGSFDTVEQASGEYVRAVNWIKSNPDVSFEDNFE